MKKALVIIFLSAAPLHGRLVQHNFSFTLTGLLGLLGEYTNADPINQSPHHFPTNNDPKGGVVPLPVNMAASGAAGLELAYTWLALSSAYIVPFGVDVHIGLRLTDMPYFWQEGNYLIQPYLGTAIHLDAHLPSVSFLVDAVGCSFSTVHYGALPRNVGFAVMIILPLGFQMHWKSLRFSLRHELEFVTGYNFLEKGQPPAYRQGGVCKYNLIFGLGWGFGIAQKGVVQ